MTAPVSGGQESRPDLDKLLYDFDKAWRGGTPPVLADFCLTASDPACRRELLEELVKIDLEYRWRQGDRPLLESYLTRFPELDNLVGLAAEEYRARQRWGDRPAHRDYAERFPQSLPKLHQALHDIDAELALERGPGSKPRPPEPAPIAAPITTHSLLEALRNQQLLPPEQLNELFLAEMQGKLTEADMLSRDLIERGWLTPFQAELLLQGRDAELVLGPYLLLERLGEGGAGQVFKARHHRMKRVVALKVLRKELLSEAEVISRFSREIQVISQLSHPNVVRAYDAGQVGGTHFLVMEHVEGVDLSRLVKHSGPLPALQACDFVRQAALGLQHIHEHGLVHRDIKPSNLLLDRRRGPQRASEWGLVRILDLGLARLVRTSGAEATALAGAVSIATLTPVGALMMGTPDYLAPEQALDFHQADVRADLYSLGCTFFFLLTGQPPFPGGTLAQKLLNHQQSPPPALASFRADVPPAVEAVLRRLLAKKPEQRFATPAELAETLADATTSPDAPTLPIPTAVPLPGLDSGPTTPTSATMLLAQPVSASDRARRFALVGLGGAALALALLLFLNGNQGQEETPPETLPTAKAVRFPLDALDPTAIPAAERRPGQPKELVAVLGEHRGRHWGIIWCVAFSPDGQLLASGGYDNVIRLWDPVTLRERDVLQGHSNSVLAVAFSPDGKQLASVGRDGSLRIWDPIKRTQVAVFSAHKSMLKALAFSPDGKQVATGGRDDNLVKVWNLAKGKEAVTIESPTGKIYATAFAPDGKHLAFGSGAQLDLVDLAKAKQVFQTRTHKGAIQEVVFSRDGKTLASASEDGTVKLWDLPSRKERLTLSHGAPVTTAAFSPTQPLLATGTHDPNSIRFWHPGTGQPRGAIPLRGNIFSVAFSPDGKTLASASYDLGIQLWDTDTLLPRLPARGHRSGVFSVAFLPDGKRLVSSSSDGDWKLWDVVAGQEIRTIPSNVTWDQDYTLSTLALSPNGKRVALGMRRSGPCPPQVFDLDSGKPAIQFQGQHAGYVFSAAFSPDEKTLASTGKDGVIILWDLASGKELRSWSAHKPGEQFIGLAFRPEGRLLASVSTDGALKVWDPATGQERFTGTHVGHPIYSVAFSPDGKYLASGGGPAIKLWDPDTGQELHTLQGHRGAIMGLAFRSDSRLLASASGDGTVRLWDIPSGDPIQTLTLTEPSGYIGGLAISPDGRHLATANGNGTIYILRLPPAR